MCVSCTFIFTQHIRSRTHKIVIWRNLFIYCHYSFYDPYFGYSLLGVYKSSVISSIPVIARDSVIKRESTGKACAWLTKLPWRAQQLMKNTVLLSIYFLFYFYRYYHYFNLLQNKMCWSCWAMTSGKRTTQGRINPTPSPPFRLARAGWITTRHRLQ